MNPDPPAPKVGELLAEYVTGLEGAPPESGSPGEERGRRAALRSEAGRSGARAEEGTSAGEEALRLLAASTGYAVLLVSPEGRIVTWNPGAERVYGYVRDEILGEPYAKLYSPSARRSGRPRLDLQMASVQGRVCLDESRLRKDGASFHAQIELVALRRETGRTVGFGEITRDASEERRAREALAREASALRQVVESSVEAVLTFDLLGRVTAANRAAEQLFDSPRATLEGRAYGDPDWGLEPPGTPTFSGAGFCFLRAARTGEAVTDAEAVLVRGDRDPLLLSFNAAATRDAWGKVSGVVVTVRDVTRQRRAVEEEGWREQVRTVLRRQSEAEEAVRRRLAREVHDELGSAVTGIRLLLEALPALPERDAREAIQEAGGLLAVLSSRVRSLSRDLRPAVLEERGLLPALNALAERHARAPDPRIRLQQSGLEGRFPPEIELAAYRTVQEALTNALRHAQAREITLRAWRGEDALHLVIEDDGKGFPFHDPGALDPAGGLSGMRGRVLLLGGRLEIGPASPAGAGGTRVQVELPLEPGWTEGPESPRKG